MRREFLEGGMSYLYNLPKPSRLNLELRRKMSDLFYTPSGINIPGTKFGDGNGDDGKHYWLTPPDLYAALDAEFHFDFDPCPYPLPPGFDGLTCEWGQSSYVNPPFGSIIHMGKKKGPTAWVRKAIVEWQKGKRVVLVYPIDKWVLMLLKAILGPHAQVRNLGNVKWLATEDGSAGNGTGRDIACFILEPEPPETQPPIEPCRYEMTCHKDGSPVPCGDCDRP